MSSQKGYTSDPDAIGEALLTVKYQGDNLSTPLSWFPSGDIPDGPTLTLVAPAPACYPQTKAEDDLPWLLEDKRVFHAQGGTGTEEDVAPLGIWGRSTGGGSLYIELLWNEVNRKRFAVYVTEYADFEAARAAYYVPSEDIDNAFVSSEIEDAIYFLNVASDVLEANINHWRDGWLSK